MKFHKNKLLTTVAAIALVLAVGACSSSDDDEMSLMMNGDGAATNGDGDATNGGDAATNGGDDTKTPAQTLAAAQDDYDTLPADATDDVRAAAMTALVAALKLEGNEAEYLAYLEKKVADQAQTVADATAKAAKDERIAREEMIRMAMAIETLDTSMANALPDVASGVTANLVASRSVAGMVTIDVNGAAEDDDYAGGATPADSGDWNYVTMTKTDAEGDTDTVVLYTDIAAPADVLFSEEHAMVASFLDAANVKKARSDNFPTGASRTIEYSADSGNPLLFRGTFDDLPGVFACTGAEVCMLSTTEKGVLEATEVVWTFTPDAANTATVKVPDAGYAYFGWWLNKPKENNGLHMVDVFADGTNRLTADVNMEIEGTATYAGPAAGKYVTRTFTGGVHSDSGVGHFTAAASLTAKFADADELGTGISGSVSNFVLDDTNSVPWKVTLGNTPFDGTASGTFNGPTEVNFGGGVTGGVDTPAAGAWQGSFYGAATDPADAPSTVAGTFDAGTDNASVVGAFGATKQ